MISLKKYLPLLTGVVLGVALSTIIIYPNKIATLFKTQPRVFLKAQIDTNLNGILYNTSIADELSKNIRVLCWVLTTPENHKLKVIHVNSTWGKRCNKLLFMSTKSDQNIDGVIALPVKEGRNTLWDKTRSALQYVYNYHFNDADWFLKADDDSYIVVENLRYMLYQYRPQTALYIGHRYAVNEISYMAGGGYVLSKKALEKFVTKVMHNKDLCRLTNEGAEDRELGQCIQNSTLFVDERDELKQKRFFPAGVEEHMNKFNKNISYWYDQMLYYDSKYGGLECCSDTPIGFHYVTPKEMYLLDYLIYQLNPFGYDKNSTEILPRKLSFEEIVKASDVDSNATEYRKHEFYHDFESVEKFKK